jgi:hypothetical protein
MQSYTELVIKVKEAKNVTTLLPSDVVVLLRPLQKVIKETSQLIQASPWSFLATMPMPSTNGAYSSLQSPASQVPLPMTPQTAALGPAVQATVPSTPQIPSYNAMFSGNVFERADAFLQMNGGSVVNSRNGSMLASSNSSDSTNTPANVISPINSMSSRLNSNGYGYNGGGKMAI